MRKTCHILTSDGPERDSFCEMTYVSMSLLKRLYPDCETTLLTDEATAAHLGRLPFCFDTPQIEPIPAEFEGNAVRSRFLKTRMRQLIDGDFVFIDADALALNPFCEVFEHGAPFAAALDRNRESPEPAFPDWVVPFYEHFSWPHPLPRYYNSGVMFMEDSPEMRSFSQRWYHHWRSLYEEFGVHQDQPSLNHTLQELGIAQHELPLPCNAMVDASPYFTRGAKIVHYFLRGDERSTDPLSLLNYLVRKLRETGAIDWAAVDRAAKGCDAWVHPTNSVRIELATRHYLRALRIVASRAFLQS